MANTRSHSIGPRMTTEELVAGYLYLPFYLVLLATLLDLGAQLLELQMSDVEFNCVWFACNFVLIWIIFGKFLVRSLRAIRFWELVQAVILGYVFYYVGTIVLTYVLNMIGMNAPSFNDDAVDALAQDNFLLMTICSVVIAPIVEETLVRGLIFGSVRRKSRVLAYIISMLFFSFMHVWSFVPSQGLWPVVLSAVQYLPAGLALAWTYEKANTIWAPIAVHILNNAIQMSILTLL